MLMQPGPTIRLVVAILLSGTCLILMSASTEARRSSASILRMLDTNHDGHVDLAEAKSAASMLFDRLDQDKDGTLDAKELHGRLTKKDLTSEGKERTTLTKAEYLAIVEERFKKADVNNDGKIVLKELDSPAGGALTKLLTYVIIE